MTTTTSGSEYSNSEHLILSKEEAIPLLNKPEGKWIKKLVGASEFLNGTERYCFWLVNALPEDIISSQIISERVEKTKLLRLSKSNKGVIDSAKTPHLFKIPNHPKSGDYIIIPTVSSERRAYIPIGFMSIDIISTNKNHIIPNGSLYEFGILTSEMHNDWMRTVAGRLESRYSYSSIVVYNTFPWPNISNTQRQSIEALAEEVLLIREDYPDKTLAELYDPNKMPPPLLFAHKALDSAVEQLYKKTPFRDAAERLEHLFELYEKLIVEEEAQAAAKKNLREVSSYD